MRRRDFLLRSLCVGVAAGLPGLARADAASYRSFRAGLFQHPRLAAWRSVDSDMLTAEASLSGRWPQELSGTFYRNGPARFERGGERLEHWFDGDGMVHAWRIGQDRVSHLGRMVRTHKYVEEAAAGQLLYPGFGTHLARRPMGNNDTINSANTNAVAHAGRLYALWEGGSATEVDPLTLATRGIKTWRDDLAALPFSAHPKIGPDGTLWNFGALPGSNKLVLWQIRPDGSLGRVGLLPVPNLAMVHDFVITERYLVFLVPPFQLEQRPGASFLAQHVWQGQQPLRALVVNKADFSLRQTLEMPAAMLFHCGNAFEDGDTIRLDACLYDDAQVLQEMSATMRGEPWPQASPSRAVLLTLQLGRGQVQLAPLLPGAEFPRVAAAVVSQRHREVFVQCDAGGNSVARVSLDTGKVDRFVFGPGWIVEEHVPVAKAAGKGLWLLGPAYDIARRQTVLNVFDAGQLSAGPLAQARLPYAAPLGFHGNFLPA